jgi:hypothetical protein
MSDVLDNSCELTNEWKKGFTKYKRYPNYPTLQDISNLIGNKVNSSQCGVVIRNGYAASYNTSVEVIEVATFIGYISESEKVNLYETMNKKLSKNKWKKPPSDNVRRKILKVTAKQDMEKILDEAFRKVFGEKG